jgi:hypothetical protein
MSRKKSTKIKAIVYFVQVENGGPIKIGKSEGDGSNRLSQLQVSSPYELVILGTVPDPAGTLESDLHWKFRHLHIRGEWFRPESDLLEFIRSAVAGGAGPVLEDPRYSEAEDAHGERPSDGAERPGAISSRLRETWNQLPTQRKQSFESTLRGSWFLGPFPEFIPEDRLIWYFGFFFPELR